MKILKVPYAEKDQAKALGARWNNDRKTWYVPEGKPSEPFAQWLTAGEINADAASAKPGKTRVDSYSSEPVTGAYYVALEHDCDPFSVCTVCAPRLQESGWTAAHEASRALLPPAR